MQTKYCINIERLKLLQIYIFLSAKVKPKESPGKRVSKITNIYYSTLAVSYIYRGENGL